MTIPSAPFCLSSDVAPYMSLRLNRRSDFEDDETGIRQTNVNIFISNVSTQIVAKFRMAGYVTPLTTNGVIWPDDQTEFLKVLTVMGVCSLLTSPLVENPGRRTGDGNSFKTMYESGLTDIYDKVGKKAGPFWGCQYKMMSPAERAVETPAVPTTSFLLEVYNPALHAGFQYWTDKSQQMQDYMEDTLQIMHNYSYGLNDLEKGPYV